MSEPMNVGVRLLKRDDERQGFIGKPKKKKKKAGKKSSLNKKFQKGMGSGY